VDKIENNVKTLYQGMWLRGERIWLSDMVRLRKHRSDLPPNKLLLAPSPGAENRGVFLKIRVIALDKLTPSNPPPGVSAAKPATDGTGEPSKEFWHCRLFGDVYELAEGEPSIEEDVKANDTKWPLDVVAPKGFYYRCINTEGSEIVLDVMDIAGRCYPDLLTADSAYFYAPDDATKSGREQANDSVMALTGLRPWPTPVAAPQAKAVPSWYRNDKAAPEWKGELVRPSATLTLAEDLYVIVRDTTADIEWNVKECYVEKLCGELNYRVPDFAQLRGKANGK
jgi:hypothetical protein